MGVNSAILDPFDRELMAAQRTAGLLLNQEIYAENYLEATGPALTAAGAAG
jgi:hypothetical protein